jgi:hypothetical protein
MRKRYLVAVDGLDKADEKQFIEFLREKGIGWWHWIPGFWMLVDPSGEDSRDAIRDYLHEMPSTTRGLVFDVEEQSFWSGFGPETTKSNMFKWLSSTWKK